MTNHAGNVVTSSAQRTLPRRRFKDLALFSLLIALAALPFLAGCIADMYTIFPAGAGTVGVGYRGYYDDYGYGGRPHPQYYCYDCHGYTYFDPYYDYCVRYGFRFRWNSYPSIRRYYREHYPVIVQRNPHFGEYKYKPDYQANPRYEKPVDYQTWKSSEGRNFYEGKNSTREKSTVGKPAAGKSAGGETSTSKAKQSKK